MFGEIPDADESLWAAAYKEFESSERRIGLWAKSFAMTDGNEVQAKVEYLKFRVVQLQKSQVEYQRTVSDIFQRRQEEIERLAQMPNGQCPNCGEIQSRTSESCPKCNAAFGPDSAWRLTPVP